jgi:hypothetical protein
MGVPRKDSARWAVILLGQLPIVTIGVSAGPSRLLGKSLVNGRAMTESNESNLVPVPMEDRAIRARLQRP